jgi:ABC-type phosphate/phosphonate transport system substrate-binding protein
MVKLQAVALTMPWMDSSRKANYMNRRRFLSLAAVLSLSQYLRADSPRTMRIGVTRSIFQDTDDNTVQASIKRFKEVMERETEIASDSTTVPDIWTMAADLMQQKLQLGVACGHEFAWCREKYPTLEPLVIAVNQDRYVRVHILANTKSSARDFADLAGKSLALALHTKPYCRLYIERVCLARGRDWEKYFGTVSRTANLEDALDDVVDGDADCALVDGVGLGRFKIRKPVRFAKLRDVASSEPFPSSLAFYRPRAVPADTLDRYRDALLRLPQTPDGKQIMLEWRLTGFENVPDDYNQALRNIAKLYPPPS